MDMEIVTTSGVDATEVPADVAADLAAAYQKLADLPVNRAINVTFADAKAAREFVRQGKAWAATQTVEVPIYDDEGKETGTDKRNLAFARKGDIKGNPTRVTFRVYLARPAKDDDSATAQ